MNYDAPPVNMTNAAQMRAMEQRRVEVVGKPFASWEPHPVVRVEVSHAPPSPMEFEEVLRLSSRQALSPVLAEKIHELIAQQPSTGFKNLAPATLATEMEALATKSYAALTKHADTIAFAANIGQDGMYYVKGNGAAIAIIQAYIEDGDDDEYIAEALGLTPDQV